MTIREMLVLLVALSPFWVLLGVMAINAWQLRGVGWP